ncbi:hypothetical protein LCGC14_1062980 [marine sediment metagenome]|uniref:Uncharacterized protein n=1 Tax=marine sediment metagenome TaxID=412755 RepID=A0A0F9MKM8_9ZZZZ
MPRELTTAVVKEWLNLVEGVFDIRELHADVGIDSPAGKSHLRVILHRMEHDSPPLVVSLGSGKYRKIDNEKTLMDWESADPDNWLPIFLPFDLHAHCLIYPKSIIIVVSGKDGGKTAFLLECLKLNYSGFTTDFFNSETGKEQFKKRVTPLNFPHPAPFNVYQRYDNFADVIEPNHLSIIDYLDFNSEVYLVGTEIDNIFRKLTTGVAIIGIQKPPPSVTFVKGVKKVIDRDLGYGGAFTIKRSVLYVSLSGNRLKVVSAKTPSDPKVRLTNMQWRYTFDDDGFFTDIQRYYGEEQTNPV